MESSGVRVVRFRPWVAVVSGIVVGVLIATAAVMVWPSIVRSPGSPDQARSRPDSAVDLFRLAEQARQLLVVRSGPDASGEPLLAARLYPGESPPREIASVLLLNASSESAWDVDLSAAPLRARTSADAPWETLEPIEPERAEELPPSLALRFRSLGGPGARVAVEPRSLRRVLVALPAGRTIGDLSDVQWGDRPLQRERLDMEAFHDVRAPGAGGGGR